MVGRQKTSELLPHIAKRDSTRNPRGGMLRGSLTHLLDRFSFLGSVPRRSVASDHWPLPRGCVSVARISTPRHCEVAAITVCSARALSNQRSRLTGRLESTHPTRPNLTFGSQGRGGLGQDKPRQSQGKTAPAREDHGPRTC